MTTTGRSFRASVEDGVARVILSRPDRNNVLVDDLVVALCRSLDEFASDPAVRALVLTAEGRHFSAGGDIAYLAEMHARLRAACDAGGDTDLLGFAEHMRANAGLTERLLQLPFPTVAAVHGACVGAAMALVGACDARLAHEDAHLSTGYASLGLGPDLGVGVLLPDLVGGGVAQRWLLDAPRLSAYEALRAGFFTGVVEGGPEDLAAQAMARARALADVAPAVLTFRSITRPRACGPHIGAELEVEARRFAESLVSPGAGARIAAAMRLRP